MWVGSFGIDEEAEYLDISWELVDRGDIPTGSVTSCQVFRCSFVRSSVVMDWIEHGYALL